MLCYVGKATKIFFFLVATLAAIGLFLGLGLGRHGWASHRAARPNPPAPCQGGGGHGPCSTITSFPDPATAAAVPPPPQDSVLVGPTTTGASPPPAFTSPPTADFVPAAPSPPSTAFTAAAPPSFIMSPPAPAPPTATATAPPPAVAPPSPITGAAGPSPA